MASDNSTTLKMSFKKSSAIFWLSPGKFEEIEVNEKYFYLLLTRNKFVVKSWTFLHRKLKCISTKKKKRKKKRIIKLEPFYIIHMIKIHQCEHLMQSTLYTHSIQRLTVIMIIWLPRNLHWRGNSKSEIMQEHCIWFFKKDIIWIFVRIVSLTKTYFL